jgi:HSF-type DNA-binding
MEGRRLGMKNSELSKECSFLLTGSNSHATPCNTPLSLSAHSLSSSRCFVVHNKKEFVDKILCLWFRQSKWASFQRQLNMYGFHRLSSGLDKGGYYHELFIQGSPQLARHIQRHKVKGNGPRRPAQPDAEPNFYAMPAAKTPLSADSEDAQETSTTDNGYPAFSCTFPATPPATATLPPALPSLSNMTLRNSVGLTLLANHQIPKFSDIFRFFPDCRNTDEQDVLALEELALLS